jgi:hypothetical protein
MADFRSVALLAGVLILTGPSISSAETRFDQFPTSSYLPAGASPVTPDFAGRDNWASNFRTRLNEGVAAGPNFAGRYVVVEIGCGTSCRFAYIVDAANGQVFPFPYGGEENYQMQLAYRVDSDLIKVNWLDGTDTCIHQDLLWNGANLSIADQRSYQPEGYYCDLLE